MGKARIKGTIEYFKCSTWGNLNKRTVNGSSPAKFHSGRNLSYKNKKILLLMTKDEFYNWCDLHEDAIMLLYSGNKTPSIGRIDHNMHYSLDNIEIQDFYENRKESSKRNVEIRVHAATVAKYKKVINIRTGEIFKSMKDAAESIGVRTSYLSRMLSGKRKNKTDLKFVNERIK